MSNPKKLSEKEKLEAISQYYNKYRLLYNLIIGGVKHFGYYPDGVANISHRKAQELMNDLVIKNLRLNKKMRILDAGCGQGNVSCYIAKKVGCRVDGVVITRFEVEDAIKLAKKMGVSHLVNYHLMDYSNTNFPDNYFDGIYTMETLCHSTNIKKSLNEFMRILKPGGKITLHEYPVGDDSKFSDLDCLKLNAIIKGAAMHSLKKIRIGKFHLTLRKAGFESIVVQDITKNMLPSAQKLADISRFFIYPFVKLFKLYEYFPNITSVNEAENAFKKGLMAYQIFTANKPKK